MLQLYDSTNRIGIPPRMANQDRIAFNRRLVLYTALLAGVILVGAGLFLAFSGSARPLLDLSLNFTTTTTT